MRNRIIVLILILNFSVHMTFAEGKPGKTSGQFLRLNPSPRANSMGNAFCSINGEADSLYYNPASIAFIKNINLSLSYIRWLQAMNYLSLYGTIPIGRAGAVGIGTFGLYDNDIIKTSFDEMGNVEANGTVTAGDYCFMAGYSYPFIGMFSAGLNLKGVYQNLENESSFGFVTDIGFFFNNDKNKIRAGLSIQNLGTKAKFVQEQFNFPFNIRFGGNYDFIFNPKNSLLFIFEIQKPLYENFGIGTGLEYVFNKMIYIRTGYEYQGRRSDTMGIKFGAGFKMKNIGINYSMDLFKTLGMTHFIQINYAFGKIQPGIIQPVPGQPIQKTPLDLADDYIITGEYDKALTEYNKVIQSDPNNIRVAYNMACIYAIYNNIDKAIIWLDYALKLDHTPQMLTRIEKDMDFEGIRHTEKFKTSINRYKKQ